MPTTIADLPDDLLVEIFGYFTRPPNVASALEIYSDLESEALALHQPGPCNLYRLCFVSRRFREIAQPLLLRDCCVEDEKSGYELCCTLLQPGMAHLGASVWHLTYGADSGKRETFLFLVAFCPNLRAITFLPQGHPYTPSQLEELCSMLHERPFLRSITLSYHTSIRHLALPSLKNLTNLRLHDLGDNFRAASLPSLKELHLGKKRNDDRGVWELLESMQPYPNLRVLSLDNVEPDAELFTKLAPHAPLLYKLVIDRKKYPVNYSVFSLFPLLSHYIDFGYREGSTWSDLPTSFQVIRLYRVASQDYKVIHDYFKNADILPNLRILHLHPFFALRKWRRRWEEVNEGARKIRELLESRGVNVEPLELFRADESVAD